MKLIATASVNRGTKSIEVYDDGGKAFIRRTEIKSGKVIEWHSPDRSADEWIGINDTTNWNHVAQ